MLSLIIEIIEEALPIIKRLIEIIDDSDSNNKDKIIEIKPNH